MADDAAPEGPRRMSERAVWDVIEREAREQKSAELIAAESVALAPGSPVAWTECEYGRTAAFSVVHRVSETPSATLCGDAIPAPVRRVALLTPRLIGTLGRCKWCENLYAKGEIYAA